ncbi:hypothetical protein CEXT_662951 [Caerostris extrusa]|uniref:Uncharacterized protein n=1 Tax=Caerostris extrusa TaxID=172846 RepID=A0AAV4WW56_CAEEX|nr:hypothetical protein CEXT_662951 [Caerostris extrusa]
METNKQTFHQITSDSGSRYQKEEKNTNLAVSNSSGISKQCDGIHGHGLSGKTNAIQFSKRGIHYDDPLLMSVREYILPNLLHEYEILFFSACQCVVDWTNINESVKWDNSR